MAYTQFLEQTLTQAASIAANNFGKVTGTVKAGDNNQVLTETDVAIGKHIVDAIKKEFPDHNVIDEEAGVIDNQSRYTWVVDPIDGTSNFAAGLPHYGIMIGLLEDATPIAGGIALPAFNEIYLAENGKGTTCNGQAISVSSEQDLLKSLVTYGIDGHQEDPALTQQECAVLTNIILGIRNLRTSNSAFDMANVASGRYGAFLNKTTKIWDNVAPQIIVEEAGGVWTDFDGQAFDYTKPLSRVDQNFTVCAGAPALHRQLQDIIHAAQS
ncbi:MAG TPA: inositol monophosphatase [Nevskiaceae bacterium]|nr:inositol monophosphatase [Nevskiaceae bacterium]